jgi:hypothetical protein
LAAPGGEYGNLSGISSGGVPMMIGDLSPLPTISQLQQSHARATLPSPFPPPTPPGVARITHVRSVVPTIRGVKFSENQSPRPQDRFFFTTNYYQGINGAVNQRLQSPIGYTQVYRYILGAEKTFMDGQGSIGIRMPIDTLTANPSTSQRSSNFGGTSTAVDNISLFAKYILLENRETGNLLSGGLALSLPTGPGNFAGFKSFASPINTVDFQPYLGYIVNSGRWYLQGFSIIDVPANSSSPTYIFNDVGIGYYLRRPDPDSRVDELITMIAPTFEVHINDPLNHRDVYNPKDISGVTDIVDLTYGINVGIRRNTIITFAIVDPITSPKPFDFEAVAFVNIFFGSPRRRPPTPPVVGGP